MLKRLIVVASVLLLMGASTASADMLQFETHLAGPFAFENPVPISLPGFNPSFGTLQQVVLETELLYSGAATFTNPGPSPFPGSADLVLVWFLQGAGFMKVAGDDRPTIIAGVIPPGASQTVQFGGLTSNPFMGPLGSSAVPSFVTAGRVPATLSVLMEVFGNGLPLDVAGQTDDVLVRVLYDYRPGQATTITPEPSSLLLLAFGATGLLVRQKRARRN
jgi:hypothetical protein